MIVKQTVIGTVRRLRANGSLAINQYHQLKNLIDEKLDASSANILAEPVDSETSIDWHSDINGLKNYSSLSDSQKVAAQNKLNQFVKDIIEALDELSAQGERELIRSVLSVPEITTSLYANDEESIVLVDWGVVREGDEARECVLRDFAERYPTSSSDSGSSFVDLPDIIDSEINRDKSDGTSNRLTSNETEAASGSVQEENVTTKWYSTVYNVWGLPWLLPLLSVVLAFLIAWMLVRSCGIGIPFTSNVLLLDYCRGDSIADAGSNSAALRELAELEGQLQSLPACDLDDNNNSANSQEPQVDLSQPPSSGDVDSRVEENSGQEGLASVSLAWNSEADLDLHIICPGGDVIYYKNRVSCGGQLDIDANNSDENVKAEPVENIFWNTQPASGTYIIRVVNYKGRDVGGKVGFTVVIKNGNQSEVHKGAVGHREKLEVGKFLVEAL